MKNDKGIFGDAIVFIFLYKHKVLRLEKVVVASFSKYQKQWIALKVQSDLLFKFQISCAVHLGLRCMGFGQEHFIVLQE